MANLSLTSLATNVEGNTLENKGEICTSVNSEIGDSSAKSNSLTRDVKATVISPYGLFYSDKELTQVLFSIPRGSEVTVLDSEVTKDVAKISYEGFIGYIRKSNLSL